MTTKAKCVHFSAQSPAQQNTKCTHHHILPVISLTNLSFHHPVVFLCSNKNKTTGTRLIAQLVARKAFRLMSRRRGFRRLTNVMVCASFQFHDCSFAPKQAHNVLSKKPLLFQHVIGLTQHLHKPSISSALCWKTSLSRRPDGNGRTFALSVR